MNYFRLYYNLVNKAHLEKRTKGATYYESHHVKPRCKGGKFEVLLTAREHFIAHLLLTKIYPNCYKLSSAFNKMFNCSKDQQRYMPISKWFEYKRKLFSKNHPLKSKIIKQKHKESMLDWSLKRTAIEKCHAAIKVSQNNNSHICILANCKNCSKFISNKRKFCSLECRSKYSRTVERRACFVCGKEHIKKYCCSKKCFDIYVKLPNNEYSKTLSEFHKDYIEKTKRGNNNSKSSHIKIFNEIGELKYESTPDTGFINMCKINNIPYKIFQSSYLTCKPINSSKMSSKNKEKYVQYDGWYAIKIKE